MNHPSFADQIWPRRDNFRSAVLVSGALSFPAFLLMASISLVLLSGVFQPAGALVRQAPVTFDALQPLPQLNDEAALQSALQNHLRNSALSSGRWQPEPAVSAVPVTNGAEVVTSAGGDRVPEPVDEAVSETDDKETNTNQIASAVAESEPVVTPGSEQAAVPEIVPAVEVRSKRLVKRPAVQRLDLTKRQARRALQAQTADDAYQLLMRELDRGAQDTEFLGLLAVSALALRKADEAHLIYQRLVVMEPDNERWWTGLAIAREQLGLSAAADYQRALALSGDDSPAAELARSRLQETG